jgi:hypothetical protein
MAFLNSISFSHRFSDDGVCHDTCSYQEINHTYSAGNSYALSRAFYQFMMACGYAPSSVCEAIQSIGSEYGEAYCYSKEKAMKD